MKKLNLTKYLLIFLLILGCYTLEATHIRGGQIFYKKINSLTYQLTFVGYRDQEGVLFGQGVFNFGDGNVFGDDPDEVIPWEVTEDLENGIERWEFSLIHTYASSGVLDVSYTEDFRTSNVRNVAESLTTAFHVEASILLDPLINNSSPRNMTSPDMIAIAGTKFVSNLVMFDEEGDSLSYQLDIPQQGLGLHIDDYVFPSDLSFYDSWTGDDDPLFSIDPISGNLLWDTPTTTGFYSIALKTTEWRKINGEFFKIGNTVIDYLVEVLNLPPVHSIGVPQSVCHIPNTSYSGQVVLTNDQNSELSISIFTDLTGVKFNGFTSEEWNEQSRTYTDSEIVIDVELLAEDAIAGFSSIYVKVKEASSLTPEPITTSAGFALGIGCSEEDLNVLGLDEENSPISITISKAGLEIHSDVERNSTLHIYDSNGKKLLNAEMILLKGPNMVSFSFLQFRPYFILLDYKKGSLTEKVLLTK